MNLKKLIRSLRPEGSVSDRIRSIFQGDERREYTFPHIVQKVRPTPIEEVAAALAELTEKSEIEKILRVESPTNAGGIGDFHNAQEIPAEIYDFRADRVIQVHPENVRVIFRGKNPARRRA
jgi:hypothetical protein